MFLNQMWQAIQLWIPWPYLFSCRKFPVHIVNISSNGNKDSSSYLVILFGTGVLVWLVFVRFHKEKDNNIKIVGRENYGDQLFFLFDSQTIFVSTLWSWVQNINSTELPAFPQGDELFHNAFLQRPSYSASYSSAYQWLS